MNIIVQLLSQPVPLYKNTYYSQYPCFYLDLKLFMSNKNYSTLKFWEKTAQKKGGIFNDFILGQFFHCLIIILIFLFLFTFNVFITLIESIYVVIFSIHMNSIQRKNVKNGQMGDFYFCFLTFSLGLFSNFIIFKIL